VTVLGVMLRHMKSSNIFSTITVRCHKDVPHNSRTEFLQIMCPGMELVTAGSRRYTINQRIQEQAGQTLELEGYAHFSILAH